ncbi:MAG: SAM-dependent methyltransferase [Gammaproteobacteria bacterium]|nr:MAG: SAM-dependent methyltransferase [Gammaproteobacteria bacterium]
MNDFPAPPAHALALSERLTDLIRKEIAAAGGTLPFSVYMERCLYTPGLGYYSAGSRKFGSAGDFITAPELSPLFGRCLAQTCSHVLEQLQGGDILEFGAGSGVLAVDVLGELERLGRLPGRYLILERSAELRERQQQRVTEQLPHLRERINWLEALPEPGFAGVLLANEVVDAMPAERFRWTGAGVEQFCVSCSDTGFDWQLQAAHDAGLIAAVQELAREYRLADGYSSEFNLSIIPWMESVADVIGRGLLLLCDYGYPRREYYHPQRNGGTLMCHYRHRAHDNPFLWPGLQDITTHVDFTAVANAGVAAGLDVAGYATQAGFLLDCGLDTLLLATGPVDSVDYVRAAQQAKQLTLPGEMGERFAFIGLAKGVDGPLPGFRMQDIRHRL